MQKDCVKAVWVCAERLCEGSIGYVWKDCVKAVLGMCGKIV